MKNKVVIITLLIIIFISIGILFNTILSKRENKDKSKGNSDMKIYLNINNITLEATLLNNTSSKELYKKLQEVDLKINLHDYGNFEKVGDLGFELPRNDERITTTPGDIILYLGKEITIYYDTNTWEFTKLGSIDNITQEKLKEILGKEDVEVTFSARKN